MTRSMSEPRRQATDFLQTTAEIRSNQAASDRYNHLVLHCPEVASRAQPGQFALLSCLSSDATERDPLLPRPMAFLDADPVEGTIEFLYFVAGRGTQLLSQTVSVASSTPRSLRLIGPLGCGFEPLAGVDVHVGVGGGSGVAPLVFFFRKMDLPGRHLILAARSAGQLPAGKAMRMDGVAVTPATDDGTAGFHGNAVEALADVLEGPLKGRRVALYVAGPEAMMLAAVRLARRKGIPIRVSLEARMACGVGVCRGCVVNGCGSHGKTGLHRFAVCQDGPVFDPDALSGEWSAET